MLRNLALVTGTDDDLPPPYQNNRGMKGSGRITGNGRDTIGDVFVFPYLSEVVEL